MENLNSVCYINKINSISPIEGADKIEKVTVNGWSAIAQKGIHEVGDLVLCMTTDAVIPQELADKWGVAGYLRKGNRVRTIKLKGVYSEVILIPLTTINQTHSLSNSFEGEDWGDILGIFKYEPPTIEVILPGGKRIRQKDNLNFNKYYKFPNHKNTPNMFNEEDEVVVTRKIHGTSARYAIIKKDKLSFWDKFKLLVGIGDPLKIKMEFLVGSHNVIKTYNPNGGFYKDNYWDEIAQKYNIEEKLWNLVEIINDNEPDLLGTGIILFGEIYGPNIQGQHYTYGLKERELALFDIEMNKQYLNRDEFNDFIGELNLPKVEVLYKGPFCLDIINTLIVNNYIPGTKNVPHEGVVCSSITGDRQKISKFINPEYHIFSERNEVPDSH